MEHIAALLLIVGCSQDMKQCEELPSPVTVYETAAECDTELPAALHQMDGSKPRVMGTCVYVDPAMEEENAELVWDLTPDGALPLAQDRPGGQFLTLMRHVKEVERLTIRAVREGDREAALQAFAAHPLVGSEELGRQLLEGYEKGFPGLKRLWAGR